METYLHIRTSAQLLLYAWAMSNHLNLVLITRFIPTVMLDTSTANVFDVTFSFVND
jgi:hypothetical protein